MILNCENATMGYDGVNVIGNLTFTVNQGDYLCIVGENGSGKTTLMKAILGLISPVRGRINFCNGMQQSDIGYLPQQTDIQKNFPASVNEIVRSGCLNKGGNFMFYSKQQKQLIADNMYKLGILDLQHKCYRELSGGQQQRVLLCRALCASEKLLILDEPVTGLDPLATNDMYDLLSQINADGITIIMVSHDITAAVNHSTHMLHLNKEEKFFGSTHQYIHSKIGKKFLFSGCKCDDCRLTKNI